MKSKALFSSKDKSKNIKCRLLQFLFDVLSIKHCSVLSLIYAVFELFRACGSSCTSLTILKLDTFALSYFTDYNLIIFQ